MRVYVKKEDKSSMILGIITIIVFFSFPVVVFISAFKSCKSFLDVISEFGTELLFAVAFFIISIFFIAAIIKHTQRYKAKLMDKKVENYRIDPFNPGTTVVEIKKGKKV